MQDDNELHEQSILTVAAFTEWAFMFNLHYLEQEKLNALLKAYLTQNGFSPDTKLIDGEYVEYLVIKE